MYLRLRQLVSSSINCMNPLALILLKWLLSWMCCCVLWAAGGIPCTYINQTSHTFSSNDMACQYCSTIFRNLNIPIQGAVNRYQSKLTLDTPAQLVSTPCCDQCMDTVIQLAITYRTPTHVHFLSYLITVQRLKFNWWWIFIDIRQWYSDIEHSKYMLTGKSSFRFYSCMWFFSQFRIYGIYIWPPHK